MDTLKSIKFVKAKACLFVLLIPLCFVGDIEANVISKTGITEIYDVKSGITHSQIMQNVQMCKNGNALEQVYTTLVQPLKNNDNLKELVNDVVEVVKNEQFQSNFCDLINTAKGYDDLTTISVGQGIEILSKILIFEPNKNDTNNPFAMPNISFKDGKINVEWNLGYQLVNNLDKIVDTGKKVYNFFKKSF